MSTFLWLIPVLPLIGFLINGLARLPKTVAAAVGCAGPIVSFGLSVAAVMEVAAKKGPIGQQPFEWITTGALSITFGLTVDQLSGVMILVVTGVGSLIHLYSISYMHDDEGFSKFFAYLNLFMFSMLILVVGDSILLMFVGWEGVGLCSYLLIGFWFKELKNADAGKKAFITNRIGDFGFLLGMFCLWQMFGTLDFKQMSGMQASEKWRVAAAALLFLGACGKSAQIPLYVWLPDAMAGPTPVSALIHAATMVTAGVYMMARMNFLYAQVPEVMGLVVMVAAATALMAGVIAVAQNDIKKVLAYSTVSQLGFMFAGIASAQFETGLYHVVTHAFFKALLFLGAGAVIHALHGEQDIRKMGGLGKKLPGLAAVFVAGGLALAGTPFTSGFFSKDHILAAVYQNASPTFGLAWLMLLATACITAFYTTRLVLVVFFNPPAHHDEHHEIHKPGMLMMAPLALLAVASLFGGLLSHPLEEFLKPVWAKAPIEISSKAKNLNITASVFMWLVGAGASAFIYASANHRAWLQRWVAGGGKGLHKLVENKFYVDEIYEYLVIAPVKMTATIAWFLIDRVIIDTLLVNGSGWIVYGVGRALRRTHTGSINVGVVSFLLGALAGLSFLAYVFRTKWQLPF